MTGLLVGAQGTLFAVGLAVSELWILCVLTIAALQAVQLTQTVGERRRRRLRR